MSHLPERPTMQEWVNWGEKYLSDNVHKPSMFRLGEWWARRPWNGHVGYMPRAGMETLKAGQGPVGVWPSSRGLTDPVPVRVFPEDV